MPEKLINRDPALAAATLHPGGGALPVETDALGPESLLAPVPLGLVVPQTETARLEEAAAGWSWVRSDLRLLFGLAAANVASMVAQTAMSLTDFYIVSLMPNAVEAQAAVSCAGLVFFSIFGLLLGAMVCTTTLVSQSLGANRPRDCSAYGWQGVWISTIFGLLGFALWPFVPQLYAWFGHDPAVQRMESVYTQIRLLSLGVSGAQVAIAHYFIGIHRPWSNTLSAVWSTLLNAVLTYAMVLGTWGSPAMGVAGAAWATVIATVFRMVWLLAAMCFGSTAGQFEARRTWRWDSVKVRRLLHVGWPSGVQFILDISAWAAFMVWIIGRFGSTHLAATATVWRYTELSFMPAVGIGLAVSTMVGRAIGERKLHLAYRRAALGTFFNMAYMGFMGLVFVVCGRFLMGIFSRDADVISLGIELLVFAAIFQLFDAVAITYNNALRGAGDTRWPTVVGAAQAWGIMIVGGWVTARCYPHLGSRGPWIFATLFVIVIGITLWIRWRRGAWEKLDVIGRQTGDDAFIGSPAEGI
jgi:MATE family multidrug resistance protein